jgi:CheY-like chemotaxis protein
MVKKEWNLFLIEDNPGDIRLVEESIAECDLAVNLQVFKNGENALKQLGLTENSVPGNKPDLILLDLNLPRINGREMLGILKANPITRNTPVVIFSSSEAEKDIYDSYENYASCYISKPADFDDYMGVVQKILRFWFSEANLPDVN